MENREILFRGFDSENNCWRYGYYTKLQDGIRKFDAIICDEDGTLTRYYIDNPKTIGQFTGLLDKNGKKIFENDITVSDYGYSGTVELDDIVFAKYECTISDKIEVIGTIHDHLLKENNGK